MRALNKTSRLVLTANFLIMSVMVWAVENPNVRGPFQRTNTPVSSGQRQRFITQPGSNPYGQYGNDIVTGNVGGGRHFRGIVPYGSTFYSGAYSDSPGSTSVSDLIRRSQDPIVNDRNPGQAQSFYDPSRTVTSLRRPDGTSGLTRPATPPQGRTNQYVLPYQDFMTPPQTAERPLSSNNLELELILARQEQLRKETELMKTGDEEDTTKSRNFFDVKLLRKPETEESEEDATVNQQQEETEPQITLEQQLFSDLQLEEAEANAAREAAPEEKPENEQPDMLSPKSDLLPDLNLEMINSAEGKRILGEYKTFNELAEHRFAEYMDTADKFIQEKQFYKAADTFSLAAIWKPNDARAFLGQSFSLLAAGEYMSSAYYLSRAFELDPAVPQKPFNLAEFVGDRDIYENRELEIRTWQERSKSPELAFLLAYISYQDHKSIRAVEAISIAKQAMPDNRAVMILDSMINPETPAP